MGLDQYAYAASRAGAMNDHYEDPTHNPKPIDLAYWRKHPNLQGWMERLAQKKKLDYTSFNGVELELDWQDIDELEKDLTSGYIASLNTTGFFFGEAGDDYYRESDMNFIREAKAHLFLGLRVFYNSSW